MVNQVLKDLQAAKRMIASKSRWCRNKYDRDGVEGMQRCAVQALRAAVPIVRRAEPLVLLDSAALKLGYYGPIALNDEADHATVMKMYDMAIAAAKGELVL